MHIWSSLASFPGSHSVFCRLPSGEQLAGNEASSNPIECITSLKDVAKFNEDNYVLELCCRQ